MQQDWSLPIKKQCPLSISFDPEPTDNSSDFINPFLCYPNCPIIGRYNRGEYKIGNTLAHLQFKCRYSQQNKQYMCGDRALELPEIMHYNLRNIPELIVNNKQGGIKNSPDFIENSTQQKLKVIWIISFGEIGRDFLNYLNHMYILANTIFLQEKLQKKIYFLPIYAHLPSNSGIMNLQVQKGLNFNNYRGQYMSFHLNKGAPAFSPNNMRLGVEGGKVVTSKQPPKQKNKSKKYVESGNTKQQKNRQKMENVKIEKQQAIHPLQHEQQFTLNWQQMQKQSKLQKQSQHSKQPELDNKPTKPSKANKEQPTPFNHQGFVHFYTSVLLEQDHRVYYHWHIQNKQHQEIIRQIFGTSTSIEQFIQNYNSFVGMDAMAMELSRLLLLGK